LYKSVKEKRDRVYSHCKEAEAMKRMVMKLTVDGIFKYGAILCLVELSTLASIFIFKLIIDLLKDPGAFTY